jgi:tRNA-dihydrouridine synthase B
MDGVTDHPYRFIMKKYGQPDVIITEFTSAEGVSRNATKLFQDFLYDESQRPIVAQIFGKDPQSFRITALILGYLGFDGIDINMGCPAKTVRQSGSGASLIRRPKLAQQIIQETMAGVEDWVNGKTLDDIPQLKLKTKAEILRRHNRLPDWAKQRRSIPVSVKTRIGYDEPVTESWISTLLEMKPAAISLHGRTLMQMYTGQANWEEIGKAVNLAKGTDTLILGNGDIGSVETATQRLEQTVVDGFLIGRATFGNPGILQELRQWRDGLVDTSTRADAIQLALEHSQIFEDTYSPSNFFAMRKHLAWYIKGFPNATDYRVALMQTNNADEVRKVLEPLLGD